MHFFNIVYSNHFFQIIVALNYNFFRKLCLVFLFLFFSFFLLFFCLLFGNSLWLWYNIFAYYIYNFLSWLLNLFSFSSCLFFRTAVLWPLVSFLVSYFPCVLPKLFISFMCFICFFLIFFLIPTSLFSSLLLSSYISPIPAFLLGIFASYEILLIKFLLFNLLTPCFSCSSAFWQPFCGACFLSVGRFFYFYIFHIESSWQCNTQFLFHFSSLNGFNFQQSGETQTGG